MDHLLMACVYSQEVWFRLLQPVGLDSYLATGEDMMITCWWLSMRDGLPSTFRQGFDSLVLLASWLICKERNCRVFDRASATPAQLTSSIINEGNAWVSAGFSVVSTFVARGTNVG